MALAQQIEESVVERTPIFDAAMEPFYRDKMETSINSNNDSTPSDSGVLLYSEVSEMMMDSMTSQSQSGNELDELLNTNNKDNKLTNDNNNSNLDMNGVINPSDGSAINMDEKIVYRRKLYENSVAPRAPKKRVSFHEDILKNTRTDNIHIEHGFITYKNGRKLAQTLGSRNGLIGAAGRYSWCTERSSSAKENHNEFYTNDTGEDVISANGRCRRLVYRNACSDVLDYGNADIYDTIETCALRSDNSGVFEYQQNERQNESSGDNTPSILDNEGKDKNSNRTQYKQSKSNSCESIGNNANNNTMGDNCYYSEPSIENITENAHLTKCVWNKEKKPKSSCLKKSNFANVMEQKEDVNLRVKKFNVHDIKHQFLDSSGRMLFGSLKSIFTIPQTERGVPEGSEDLQTVVECIPDTEQMSDNEDNKNKIEFHNGFSSQSLTVLSKSLDGNKHFEGKKFVHNVDDQLRRKIDATDNVIENNTKTNANLQCPHERKIQKSIQTNKAFRNKFIVNCESTVFEHTGISYEMIQAHSSADDKNVDGLSKNNTPCIAEPAEGQLRKTLMESPFAKTFSNFFRSLKESTAPPTPTHAVDTKLMTVQRTKPPKEQHSMSESVYDLKMEKYSTTQFSSNISEISSSSSIPNSCTLSKEHAINKLNDYEKTSGLDVNTERQSRHLLSPTKKRYSNVIPQRAVQTKSSTACVTSPAPNGSGRDSKSTILSEEFEDILTITTTAAEFIDNDKQSSDSNLVIIDDCEISDQQSNGDFRNLLKPHQAPSSKASLINRFLRSVTQKKILESSIRKNQFFANKLRNFNKHLYLRGAKPKNRDLIDDLNAEIAMEIEMSAVSSPRRELIVVGVDSEMFSSVCLYEAGIGEIPVNLFYGKTLNLFHNSGDCLIKIFKLYTGYSREGCMSPVLVFLTDKSLYVVDIKDTKLSIHFCIAYKDLDIILMSPFGSTILLSNSNRDMQQVLLTGGSSTANGFVANVELCARRSGTRLPAIGQLTLEHLAPLREFVITNSCAKESDKWVLYTIVIMPARSLSALLSEDEQLGPHIKGFLMYKRIRKQFFSQQALKMSWNPGYFLLKAGVIYLFSDSNQKIPIWAVALAECRGARRTTKALRPHCFEIILRDGEILQMAAPDEYVASEWLQTFLQSASELSVWRDKHKALGCTLILTQNHLITLREDFSAPLNKLNEISVIRNEQNDVVLHQDNNSWLNSDMSTPLYGVQQPPSSASSTPSRRSQISLSTTNTHTTINSSFRATNSRIRRQQQQNNTLNLVKLSCKNMSSAYGLKSGLQVLTCADIKELTGIKISAQNNVFWCILEFSCQEAPLECFDDLILLFTSREEMQIFLRLLEKFWRLKNIDLFPITLLDEDEPMAEQCTFLHNYINNAWKPLISAAQNQLH